MRFFVAWCGKRSENGELRRLTSGFHHARGLESDFKFRPSTDFRCSAVSQQRMQRNIDRTRKHSVNFRRRLNRSFSGFINSCFDFHQFPYEAARRSVEEMPSAFVWMRSVSQCVRERLDLGIKNTHRSFFGWPTHTRKQHRNSSKCIRRWCMCGGFSICDRDLRQTIESVNWFRFLCNSKAVISLEFLLCLIQ